jgi:hypothetical protein
MRRRISAVDRRRKEFHASGWNFHAFRATGPTRNRLITIRSLPEAVTISLAFAPDYEPPPAAANRCSTAAESEAMPSAGRGVGRLARRPCRSVETGEAMSAFGQSGAASRRPTWAHSRRSGLLASGVRLPLWCGRQTHAKPLASPRSRTGAVPYSRPLAAPRAMLCMFPPLRSRPLTRRPQAWPHHHRGCGAMRGTTGSAPRCPRCELRAFRAARIPNLHAFPPVLAPVVGPRSV